MNSLVSSACTRRLLMALAAISGICLTAGCGSSNGIVKPLPGGFSKSSLKGQYVMRQSGTAFNSVGAATPFSETSVFTADGNGKLSITDDDIQFGGTQGGPETLSGTYHINGDGTGQLIFNYSPSPSTYEITMIDDSHFYVMETDLFATSSGFGQMQQTSAFTAAPSGTFVFKAHNVDTSSRVGAMAITGGAISGTEDLLALGFLATNQSISTTIPMSAPDSTNGRGTFTLSDGSSFNYYVINSSEFYFMSNSASGSLEIGQAEAQTGGPFSAATLAAGNSYVFGSSGDTTLSGPAGIHSVGVFTTNGVSGITGGTVDYVQDATVNSDLAVSGGSYSLTGNGRGTVSLTLSGGAISPQIFWMVNGTRAYFLANNSAAVEDGVFSLQQGAPFTALTSQAVFVMDGFDTSFKDRVGVFAPTSSGFNWNQTANAFGSLISTLGTTGTYQVSSNGRVAVMVNGVSNSLVFYLSSANTGFMVQEDADVGGEFAQQASQ
jgi:hypothetical protein